VADFTHLIENWSNGIVQAVDGDRVPDTALLDAKNTQFWKNSSGDSIIGTRSGLRLATQFISASIELNRFRYYHQLPCAPPRHTSVEYMLE
jgi:hypothetical protein